MTGELAAGAPGPDRARGEPFFFGVGLVLLAIVAGGFAPAFFSRLVGTLSGSAPLILAVELALFVALFAYDFRTRRKPSWPAVLGLTLYGIALGAKLTVAEHPGWHSVVDMLFG